MPISTSSATENERIRVVIIDDHPAIREALASTINTKMGIEVCGQAASAAEALVLIRQEKPHVAIVDLSLEDVQGLELVHTIKLKHPEVQVVVFSMYDEQVYAERAIRAGASAYLMKSESSQQVIDAIRAVHSGQIYLSQAMATSILSKGGIRRSGTPGFAIDQLTEREMLVFQLLGQGFTMSEIANHLKVEPKTAETYRRRAKEKLGLDSVGELLQYAVRWAQS
jgi:DNA-binding NarL/FixJ family response regulator